MVTRKPTTTGAARHRKKRLLITGIAGGLATQLASAIPDDWEVMGIGRRPPAHGLSRKIIYRSIDITKKTLEDLFRNERFDAVIHLAVANDPRLPMIVRHNVNVIATMRLLDCCESHHIPQVILVSTSEVYGADPTNPIFLTEESPLRAIQRFIDMGDKVEFDTYCRSWMYRVQHSNALLLRPCHIVGPHVQNFFTLYFRNPVVPIPLGYDPMIQVIDERDMVQALVSCLKQPGRGVYNITGPGEIPLSIAIKEAGSIAVPVLYSLASPLIKVGWWLGLLPFPTPQFDFLMYPCVIDGSRFGHDFQFKPHYSLRQTIRSLRGRRRFVGRDEL
ncbi:MAG: NAD-dependent epimerase/dehydratase family protein [Acidobacteria bacterium]|nr:NAD-dependent epimerase/dehydratase family protein [Acidobacteriota bacterium]MBI3658666.1 NAD-dependent epimerase/dehydratase family protein [Acidobacteriota bacterium]